MFGWLEPARDIIHEIRFIGKSDTLEKWNFLQLRPDVIGTL